MDDDARRSRAGLIDTRFYFFQPPPPTASLVALSRRHLRDCSRRPSCPPLTARRVFGAGKLGRRLQDDFLSLLLGTMHAVMGPGGKAKASSLVQPAHRLPAPTLLETGMGACRADGAFPYHFTAATGRQPLLCTI